VIAAQRANRERLWTAIKDLPGITPRVVPAGSQETADALVFTVADRRIALACRAALVARGVSTKILPEATTWHFAGSWSHMPQLVAAHGGDLASAFPRSKRLLECAVSLPVMVKMADGMPGVVRGALSSALSPAPALSEGIRA
jgi:8-amino-3,8-dideoxy-alpha-D-manno-octulosonate transaminase